MAGVRLGVLLVARGLIHVASSAGLKPIQTQRTKDLVITLPSKSGQWTQGKNTFVLELISVTVGKVALNTSMSTPGMLPMRAGATLSPDAPGGRYLGTISFPAVHGR
jgi:hypothetical protein